MWASAGQRRVAPASFASRVRVHNSDLVLLRFSVLSLYTGGTRGRVRYRAWTGMGLPIRSISI